MPGSKTTRAHKIKQVLKLVKRDEINSFSEVARKMGVHVSSVYNLKNDPRLSGIRWKKSRERRKEARESALVSDWHRQDY